MAYGSEQKELARIHYRTLAGPVWARENQPFAIKLEEKVWNSSHRLDVKAVYAETRRCRHVQILVPAENGEYLFGGRQGSSRNQA